MNISEFEFIQHEANTDSPIIALASILSKVCEQNISSNTDEKLLNQKATRFILSILSKKEGLNQNDIVRVSHLKGATISTTLNILEKEGLIERRADSYDHRSYRIYLTKKGRELNQTREKILNALEKDGMAGITPKELKDTKAEWRHLVDDNVTGLPMYVCSNCAYSALNDFRGNSAASKFCPHCGKYMTNHDQPED